eukprot:Lithocolla_globosa_v1_NODE_4156_length_1498_cov_11.607762.p1 type:complete len:396 gc:universal NODE_4156_length_1498_cov_11.607762:1324-137(-)
MPPLPPPTPPSLSPSKILPSNGVTNALTSDAINKLSLRPTTTRIRTKTGELFEERKDADGIVTLVKVGQEQIDSTNLSRILPAWYWDKETQTWKKQDEDAIPSSTCSSSSSSSLFRHVTYNVWFSDFQQQPRCHALISLLEQLEPHLVCFQEVTEVFLKTLSSHSWIQDKYVLSDAKGLTVYPYGVLIMVERSFWNSHQGKFEIHHLPSNMGRRFLLAEFSSSSSSSSSPSSSPSSPSSSSSSSSSSSPSWLKCGTAHLESMANTDIRLAQLNSILSELSPSHSTHAIFAGDTNFPGNPSQTSENRLLSATYPEFSDVWTKLRKEEKGDTGHAHGRIDKCFLRSQQFKAINTKLLGDSPWPGTSSKDVPKEHKLVFPDGIYTSDHFGLMTDFQLL